LQEPKQVETHLKFRIRVIDCGIGISEED